MNDLSAVRIGDQVFCTGRTDTFGSVREVRTGQAVIDVWIENHGDVAIDRQMIHAVHDGKVELDWDELPPALRRAIEHAHDREDP
ncbi:MAG: hypothetical protein AAF602_17850 [Myxococcota bacterium]